MRRQRHYIFELKFCWVVNSVKLGPRLRSRPLVAPFARSWAHAPLVYARARVGACLGLRASAVADSSARARRVVLVGLAGGSVLAAGSALPPTSESTPPAFCWGRVGLRFGWARVKVWGAKGGPTIVSASAARARKWFQETTLGSSIGASPPKKSFYFYIFSKLLPILEIPILDPTPNICLVPTHVGGFTCIRYNVYIYLYIYIYIYIY